MLTNTSMRMRVKPSRESRTGIAVNASSALDILEMSLGSSVEENAWVFLAGDELNAWRVLLVSLIIGI